MAESRKGSEGDVSTGVRGHAGVVEGGWAVTKAELKRYIRLSIQRAEHGALISREDLNACGCPLGPLRSDFVCELAWDTYCTVTQWFEDGYLFRPDWQRIYATGVKLGEVVQ